MELDIVYLAAADSSEVADWLDTIFDDLFTPFGDNDHYFASNVGYMFLKRRHLVAINQ